MFETITILLVLAAAFSLINEKILRLQTTIGLMLLGLIFSIVLTILNHMGFNVWDFAPIKNLLAIDFSQVVLQGMLCFLLFAGAMNISIKALREYKWDILILAFLGTLLATVIIGSLIWVVLTLVGVKLSLLWCLVFGAIISPTDPIAALAILTSAGLPESLSVILDGESQLNDGVGVVIFVTLMSIISGEAQPHATDVILLFLREVLGGALLGLITGFATYYLMRYSRTSTTQIVISLAVVSLTYGLAEMMHVSGPIASVILGLAVGQCAIPVELTKQNQSSINDFWNIANHLLNAILFVLIGLEVMSISIFNVPAIVAILIAIVVVLFGRYSSVYISMLLLNVVEKYKFASHTKLVNLFTWSGLRGALAIALVLSLPEGAAKELLSPMVYGVVVFSILVQGLTLPKLFTPKKLEQLTKDN